MSDFRSQIVAYALWLQDRGITGPLSIRSVASKTMTAIDDHAPDPKISVDDPATISGTQTSNVSLIIVSDELEQQEHQMLLRILSALNLSPESYRIVTELDEISNNRLPKGPINFLALGASGSRLLDEIYGVRSSLNQIVNFPDSESKALLIPHPKSMLLQPTLKLEAWDALQKLRKILNT